MFWQIIFIMVLLIPLVAIVLDSQVGKAFAARLERGHAGGDGEVVEQRLQALEAEVDRLSTEVSRLEEESDFLHKLLADRPTSPPDGPPELRSGGDEG